MAPPPGKYPRGALADGSLRCASSSRLFRLGAAGSLHAWPVETSLQNPTLQAFDWSHHRLV